MDCQRVNKLVEMVELLKNEDVPTLENTKDDQEKDKKKKGKKKGKKKRKRGDMSVSDNTADISVEDPNEPDRPKLDIQENDPENEGAEGEDKEGSDEDSQEMMDPATLHKVSKVMLSLFLQYNMQSTDIMKTLRQHD